jgi:hypothetical protein
MPHEYPPGWDIAPTGDPDHPWSLQGPGDPIACEAQDEAAALAWRLHAEDLALGREPAPHPAPVALVRALCEMVGGQRASSRILRCSERVVRKWCAGDSVASHAAVELLRRLAGEILRR